MKNLSTILGGLSLAGVIVLFVLQFKASPKVAAMQALPAGTQASTGGGAGRIAFVNIDSLENHYEYLKQKREDFKRRQSQMESELQRSASQMQSDIEEVQKKAQANTLTQTEYETAQKRIGQMQQSLENRKQSMTEQLMKEQDEFNKELKVKLDSFMEEYNKTRGFDYILSYSGSVSSILYANKALDITKEVIDGMNALNKK
jgi:outer membrane protein